jgi:hypothetical protein
VQEMLSTNTTALMYADAQQCAACGASLPQDPPGDTLRLRAPPGQQHTRPLTRVHRVTGPSARVLPRNDAMLGTAMHKTAGTGPSAAADLGAARWSNSSETPASSGVAHGVKRGRAAAPVQDSLSWDGSASHTSCQDSPEAYLSSDQTSRSLDEQAGYDSEEVDSERCKRARTTGLVRPAHCFKVHCFRAHYQVAVGHFVGDLCICVWSTTSRLRTVLAAVHRSLMRGVV